MSLYAWLQPEKLPSQSCDMLCAHPGSGCLQLLSPVPVTSCKDLHSQSIIDQYVSVTAKQHDTCMCILSLLGRAFTGLLFLVWCGTLVPTSLIGRSMLVSLSVVMVS